VQIAHAYDIIETTKEVLQMEELTQTQVERRSEIIKDIIKKRPELNGCTYTSERYYDYDRNYERVRMVPNKPLFGYDPDELYTLRLSINGYTLRESLSELYDRKGITQKQNRFEERIVNPLRNHVSNVGIIGLYRVRTSRTNVGHVHAVSLEEAKRVADITYGFLIAGKTDRWGEDETLRVSFSSQGGVGDIGSSNQRDVENIKSSIESAREKIATCKKDIKQYEAELMAIQMSELSQLDSIVEEDAA
jgi:hypothetical protein